MSEELLDLDGVEDEPLSDEVARAKMADVWAIDAPQSAKLRFETETERRLVFDRTTRRYEPRDVQFPADAARNASGGRQAVRGQHNWVPVGPRNVGGMIRALVIHPTNPLIMYAGGDSGGVFRTRDGAESWEPLWHDEASLAVSGLSICESRPDVVWAATGSRRGGSPEGKGVYRTEDGGDNWTNPSTGDPVPGTGDDKATRFEAIAAHPDDDQHCWAVGPAGIFRTRDGGRTWEQFEAGTAFSDVAFANKDGTPVVFLVRAENNNPGNFGHVYRIPAATADVGAALGAAANVSRVRTHTARPDPDNVPARAKLAICQNTPNVAYVRWTDSDHRANGGKTINVYRARNAISATNASAITWRRLPRSPDWRSQDGDNEFHEGQADHNLSIAVNPDDPDEVATGMIDLHVSTNANATNRSTVRWKRATAWDAWVFDQGQHADNHAAVFRRLPGAPSTDPPALWVGNDGGVSVTTNWRDGASYPRRSRGAVEFPLDGDEVRWRKRSHGLDVAQMYDLTRSPLIPSVYGCGFQDMGVWITAGGPTWTFVLGGDGGFVAWDPDDPYRFHATWQRGIAEVEFPGRLEGSLPRPGDAIEEDLWPRELELGFLPTDEAAFTADTAHHPRQARRILHARQHRVYGRSTATGDHWRPEGAGHGIELIAENAGNEATIEVRPSVAGHKLGLIPRVARAQNRVRTRGVRTGPHRLANGDKLALSINGTARPDIELLDRDLRPGRSLAAATTAEVCDVIRRKDPTVNARPVFFGTGHLGALLSTRAVDGSGTITVGGSACWLLGVAPGTYRATGGGPAMVMLGVTRKLPTTPVTNLTVQVGTGPTRTVRIEPPHFADPSDIKTDELIASLAAALHDDPVGVSFAPHLVIEMRGTSGNQLTVTGSAAGTFGAGHGPQSLVRFTTGLEDFNLTSPTGSPLQLTIADGATTGPALTLDAAAGIADITAATSAELTTILTTYVATNGIRASVTDDGLAVRLTGSPAGTQLTVSGTALKALGLPLDGVARPVQRIDRSDMLGLNLTGLSVTVDDNTNPAGAALTFNQAMVTSHQVNDLTAVTLPELLPLLQRHVAPLAARAYFDLSTADGHPTEITYSPTKPDRVWIGAEHGTLIVSDDDGATYRPIDNPRLRRGGHAVEAIAFHPTAADVAYVGMRGTTRKRNDHGFLFRTSDGGSSWNHIGATVVDSGGKHVEVKAIETDPEEPDSVYVGTPVGVFRSTDRGDRFEPFNHGLPNARVVDMDLDPATRTLRAALWGRGIFARHVGTQPAHDTHLYVRTTHADDGVRPVLRGPDSLALAPEPQLPSESPDIKVSRYRPGGVGTDPQIDGVEFDTELETEPLAPGQTNVYLQVHNRGAFSATNVRMVALWADASDGPPPLPDDFWSQYRAGSLSSEVGAWRLVGDGRVSDPEGLGRHRVEADRPRVLTYRPTFPAAVARMRRVGILVVVTCDEDPIDTAELDIAKLLDAERRVAYRELETHSEDADGRVFIAATRGARISVAAASTPSALTRLFTGAAGPAAELTGRPETVAGFDLSTTSARGRGIVLSSRDEAHTITLRATDFPNIAAVTDEQLTRFLNNEFVRLGMQLRAERWTRGSTPFVRLRGVGGARFRIMGGTALPALRGGAIPTAPARARDLRTRATYALADGNTLDLSINDQVTVRFRSDDFANIAAARTHEVRRVLNREMRLAHFPARAAPRVVDLRIHLVAEPAAVAEPDRPHLFHLQQELGAEKVGANTFLYLRSANHGNARQAAARHRLFELDLSAGPITHSVIGAPETDDVAPGTPVINQFEWAPATAAVAGRRIVLAIVDHATDRPLDPPANFADLDALEEFCRPHNNATYRVFEVAT